MDLYSACQGLHALGHLTPGSLYESCALNLENPFGGMWDPQHRAWLWDPYRSLALPGEAPLAAKKAALHLASTSLLPSNAPSLSTYYVPGTMPDASM